MLFYIFFSSMSRKERKTTLPKQFVFTFNRSKGLITHLGWNWKYLCHWIPIHSSLIDKQKEFDPQNAFCQWKKDCVNNKLNNMLPFFFSNAVSRTHHSNDWSSNRISSFFFYDDIRISIKSIDLHDDVFFLRNTNRKDFRFSFFVDTTLKRID